MSQPKLVAVLPVEDLLESVALPDRRVTLHRVFFDLYARDFPARASLPVALVFCGGAGEFAGAVRAVDMGGAELGRVEFRFRAATFHVHLARLALVLEAPGEHRVEVMLENRPLAWVPLWVLADGPEGQGR